MIDLVAAVGSWFGAFAIPVLLAGVVCSLIAAEALSYGTKIGGFLVRLAALLKPLEQRDRYREEWTADVQFRSDSEKHQLTGFIWAVGILFAELIQCVKRYVLSTPERVEHWAGTPKAEDRVGEVIRALLACAAYGLAMMVVIGSVSGIRAGLYVGIGLGPGFGLVVATLVGAISIPDRAWIAGLWVALIVGTAGTGVFGSAAVIVAVAATAAAVVVGAGRRADHALTLSFVVFLMLIGPSALDPSEVVGSLSLASMYGLSLRFARPEPKSRRLMLGALSLIAAQGLAIAEVYGVIDGLVMAAMGAVAIFMCHSVARVPTQRLAVWVLSDLREDASTT